ncbi:MAG TPA: DUF1330 domain-containing protein [Solirubrobacterales bacterium]|nr:DUF1330 domain-containing protein [Solirubrobacterales bacterium]
MEAAQPERLNQGGFTAFSERTGETGPVVMLNLLAFKPDGGQERYMEYGAAVAPLLDRAGGRIVWAGSPAQALLGDGSWDLVALVEYPTRQAFLDMIASPEYQSIAHLRTEALTKGELHPMDPAEESPSIQGTSD